MPTPYIDPFGGGVVNPSPVSWRELAATVSPLQLEWPGYDDSAYYTAKQIDITSSLLGQILVLPPANVVSPGESILFINRSANTVTVNSNNAGPTVGTIAAGAARLVYLKSNATDQGVWDTVLFGVGTGTLDIAAAAGAGLEASSAQLILDWPVETKSTGFTIAASYRAKVQVWSGGAGTATFPAASVLGAGFLMAVRNQGTGSLFLDTLPGDSLDGIAGGFVIQPRDACLIFCDGATNFWTVGLGVGALQFAFTRLAKSIAGSATLTLNEAANVIQEYSGALAAAAEITVPGTTQTYYVSNLTTGGFSLTFKVSGTGGTAVVAANASAVLVCNGTDVRVVAGGGVTPSENTFTPTMLGATTPGVTTYTKQAGVYQRIGNWVHFQLDVRWSAATGTGNIKIGGFPVNFDISGTSQSFSASYNTAAAAVFSQADAADGLTVYNASTFAALAIAASGSLRISGSYRVA